MLPSVNLWKAETEDALLNHFQPTRGLCSLKTFQYRRFRWDAQTKLASGPHCLWGACRSFSNRKPSRLGMWSGLNTLAYSAANVGDSFINCSWKISSGWMNRWYGLIDTVELFECPSNMRESSIKSSLLSVRPCQALEAQKCFTVSTLSAADSLLEYLHFSSGGPSTPDYTWILENFPNVVLAFLVHLARMDLR